jgi:hypothetical protein
MRRKAQELAMGLFEETRKHFPEISFLRIDPHPEQARRFWIRVVADMDDERQMAMDEFVADRAMDILMAHKYSFAIMLKQPDTVMN